MSIPFLNDIKIDLKPEAKVDITNDSLFEDQSSFKTTIPQGTFEKIQAVSLNGDSAMSSITTLTKLHHTPDTFVDVVVKSEVQRNKLRNRNSILKSSGQSFAKNVFAILNKIKEREEDRHRIVAPAPTMTRRTTTMKPVTPQRTVYREPQRKFIKKEECRHKLPALAPTVMCRRITNKLVIPQARCYNKFSQEQYNKKKEEVAGIKIDTGNTYLRKSIEGNQPSMVSATQIINPPVCHGLFCQANRTPIIIVPTLTTSLINIYNSKDILQDLKYVSTEEKKMPCGERVNEILLKRQKDGGVTVPYKVIDNPHKLTSDDWDRVVAVFVMGQVWQFKGWPWDGNPVQIFSKICGFHLKYDEMQLSKNVERWDVCVIPISRNKRYLDRAALRVFWEKLDMHMMRNKRHLRF